MKKSKSKKNIIKLGAIGGPKLKMETGQHVSRDFEE
jgi:hypothetical protein